MAATISIYRCNSLSIAMQLSWLLRAVPTCLQHRSYNSVFLQLSLCTAATHSLLRLQQFHTCLQTRPSISMQLSPYCRCCDVFYGPRTLYGRNCLSTYLKLSVDDGCNCVIHVCNWRFISLQLLLSPVLWCLLRSWHSTWLQLDRKNPPPPRGGFLFTMFPHQEPWVRGLPSQKIVPGASRGVLLLTVLDEATY